MAGAATSVARKLGRRGRTAVRSAGRKADLAVVALGERAARRVWPYLPHTIRLDYPPTAEPTPRYGFGRPPHPGLLSVIERHRDRYAAELAAFAPLFDDVAGIPLHGEDGTDPCWIHYWLIGLDILSIYGFARLRKPARYVEVGSGQSTKLVAKARRDGQLSTTITSIDPAPRAEVDALCDRVVRAPLERVSLEECFGEVSTGDMVFFDGTHRVLPNSDCVAFFLDVLPTLPPGVLVGIHDIYLPDDYPDPWFQLWWSEQYLLAAFLLDRDPRLSIVLPSFYASGQPELAALVDGLFGRPELASVNRRGSSFWIETR